MMHIVLHFLVPLLIAAVFYRGQWRKATIIMIATMLVDVDHLLANPIYDPNRCSIGFHPLHSIWAIVIYTALFLIPVVLKQRTDGADWQPASYILHLIGLGLLIHMALDWIDCLV